MRDEGDELNPAHDPEHHEKTTTTPTSHEGDDAVGRPRNEKLRSKFQAYHRLVESVGQQESDSNDEITITESGRFDAGYHQSNEESNHLEIQDYQKITNEDESWTDKKDRDDNDNHLQRQTSASSPTASNSITSIMSETESDSSQNVTPRSDSPEESPSKFLQPAFEPSTQRLPPPPPQQQHDKHQYIQGVFQRLREKNGILTSSLPEESSPHNAETISDQRLRPRYIIQPQHRRLNRPTGSSPSAYIIPPPLEDSFERNSDDDSTFSRRDSIQRFYEDSDEETSRPTHDLAIVDSAYMPPIDASCYYVNSPEGVVELISGNEDRGNRNRNNSGGEQLRHPPNSSERNQHTNTLTGTEDDEAEEKKAEKEAKEDELQRWKIVGIAALIGVMIVVGFVIYGVVRSKDSNMGDDLGSKSPPSPSPTRSPDENILSPANAPTLSPGPTTERYQDMVEILVQGFAHLKYDVNDPSHQEAVRWMAEEDIYLFKMIEEHFLDDQNVEDAPIIDSDYGGDISLLYELFLVGDGDGGGGLERLWDNSTEMTSERRSLIQKIRLELEQRFVLSVFYFATSGATWKQSCNFLTSDTSVCDWSCRYGGGVTVGSQTRVFDDMGVTCGKHVRKTPSRVIDDRIDTWTFDYRRFLTSRVGRTVQFDTAHVEEDAELMHYATNLTNHVVGLEIEDNTLIGMIPNVLQSLSNLHVLRLSANVLTGLHFMERIVNPGQLQVLDLSNNRFFGLEFASGIGSFSNLISIDYSRSGLGAAWKKLPTGLGQLSDSLRSFRATFAGLGATIPTEVGLLAKLEIFDVQLNLLTGMVPTELAQLTRLKDLRLQENRLVGTLDPVCDANNHSTTTTTATRTTTKYRFTADCSDQAGNDEPNDYYVQCSCCTSCCALSC